MASFLDPFGEGVSVVSGGGGLSRPSQKRHRSRSRSRTRSHHHRHSSRRRRSRSRSSSRGHRSTLGAGLSSFFDNDDYRHKSGSRSSFLGIGVEPRGHHSRSSFFGFGGGRPSYYKRSSRHGFLHRSYKQLKRLLRDLARWAKRHPWKVFFMVIAPLITGGALTALLARFGLRLPRSLESLLGLASKAATGNAGGAIDEAVRMAGSFGGPGASTSTYSRRVTRPSPGASWEDAFESFGRGGRGSGGAWDAAAGVAKMFL